MDAASMKVIGNELASVNLSKDNFKKLNQQERTQLMTFFEIMEGKNSSIKVESTFKKDIHNIVKKLKDSQAEYPDKEAPIVKFFKNVFGNRISSRSVERMAKKANQNRIREERKEIFTSLLNVLGDYKNEMKKEKPEFNAFHYLNDGIFYNFKDKLNPQLFDKNTNDKVINYVEKIINIISSDGSAETKKTDILKIITELEKICKK